MRLPLEGIKVVELALSLGAPWTDSMLGDFGADVIKVERHEGDRTRKMGTAFKGGEGATFVALNRNKRGIVCDITKDEGKEIVRRLVKQADVITENFRPGVMERLGLGYEDLAKINPRLVYLNITGFGAKGPWSKRPGVEVIFQGLSGLMWIQGPDAQGRPQHIGAAISDMAAGLVAAVGVMLALFERERSGLGQKIETSNLASTLSMFCIHAQRYFWGEERQGPMIVPHRAFKTKDGWIAISLPSDQYWPSFCKSLGIENLQNEWYMATNIARVQNKDAVEPLLEGVLIEKTTDEWLKIFEENDTLGGPICSYADVFQNPQVLANDLLVDIDHPACGKINMVGIPLKLSRTPGRIKSPPPLLGQHTNDILRELEYSDEQVETLRARKVVK